MTLNFQLMPTTRKTSKWRTYDVGRHSLLASVAWPRDNNMTRQFLTLLSSVNPDVIGPSVKAPLKTSKPGISDRANISRTWLVHAELGLEPNCLKCQTVFVTAPKGD